MTRASDRGVGRSERSSRRDTEDEPRDLDPGAYIGRLPEREADTIPGGIDETDERIAAHSSRVGGAQERPIGGHRQGEGASSDRLREAGEDR